MNITINVPEQLGKRLQAYATAHDISVSELTTDYWQTIVQDDVDEAIVQELDRRRLAYERGEAKMLSEDEFKEKLYHSLNRVRGNVV